MKLRAIVAAAVPAMLAVACEKPPADTSSPAPPSLSATADGDEAVRAYPALAEKDSAFSRAFWENYRKARVEDPYVLTRSDWPVALAKRTALMLHVTPVPLAPVPTPEVFGIRVTPVPQN